MDKYGLAAVAVMCGISPGGWAADAFPTKPVRFVIPFAPGGGNDLVARVLAQNLSDTWKQQVIPDNRAGGGGTIGTQIVASAPPDGYTLLLGYTGTLAINPSLYPDITYDPIKDFSPVAMVAGTALIAVVHPSVPATTTKELIAYAKSKPGALNFASGGTGTGSHMAGEMFKAMAGVNMELVSYRGTGPAIVELIAGQTQLMFSVVPAALPHIQGKRLRAIGVTSLQRSALMPELPTISESGLKGYEAVLRYGILVPRKTPPGLISKIEAEAIRIVNKSEVRQLLATSGTETLPGTSAEYAKVIAAELQAWAKVIKTAGIKP